jgi:hypothetical protein
LQDFETLYIGGCGSWRRSTFGVVGLAFVGLSFVRNDGSNHDFTRLQQELAG